MCRKPAVRERDKEMREKTQTTLARTSILYRNDKILLLDLPAESRHCNESGTYCMGHVFGANLWRHEK